MTKRALPLMPLVLCALLSSANLTTNQSIALYFVIAGLVVAVTLKRHLLFHPIYLVLVASLLGYPLSAIAYEVMPPPVGQMTIAAPAAQLGMLWAVRAFAAMALGFAMVHLWPCRGDGSSESRPRAVKVATRLVSMTGGAALLGQFISLASFGMGLTFIEHDRASVDSAQGSLAMVLEVFGALKEPFIVGYFILWRRGIRTRWLNGVALALAALIIGEIVSIGSKAAILTPLVAIIAGVLAGGAKLRPRQLLLLGLSGVAVYFSFLIVTEYRSRMHEANSSGEDISSFEVQAQVFGEALRAVVALDDSSSSRETEVGTREVTHRLGASLVSFLNLLNDTHENPPFENAWESSLLPVYAVLPRALIDKPIFFNSGENARLYYGRSYGGISVSMVGSFYYAWGYLGIVLGMYAFGMVLAVAFRPLVSGPIGRMKGALIGTAVLILAIQPDMTFQSMGVLLVRIMLAVLVLSLLARNKARPSGRLHPFPRSGEIAS